MPTNTLGKRFLTIKEFCEETRISRTTLHRHMKEGLVSHTKIGGRVLISSSIVDKLAAKSGEDPR
jgi:excisionase family DNA binding protein